MSDVNIDELKKESITYGVVTFEIRKLSAVKAMEVVEILRVSLANTLTKLESSNNYVRDVLSLILTLPPEIVDKVKKMLFSSVVFRKEGEVKGGLPLEPQYYDMAFQTLDVFNIYELIARCLFVNFFYTVEKLKQFMALVLPNPPT